VVESATLVRERSHDARVQVDVEHALRDPMDPLPSLGVRRAHRAGQVALIRRLDLEDAEMCGVHGHDVF
jgi:hypothetical protein